MAGTYLPQAGWPVVVSVNGSTLSVDSFDWNGECNVIPTPSFTASGKMEHVPGMVSGTFSCAGTWNRSFNPNGHGIGPGKIIPFIVRLNTGAIAIDDDAIVAHFRVFGEAPGTVRYELSMVMDWAFEDFAGNIVVAD